MKRGFALVGILLLLSGGVAEARLPQVNDSVNIAVENGFSSIAYIGTITSTSDNLVCLNCSYSVILASDGVVYPHSDYGAKGQDICLVLEKIRRISFKGRD